MDASVMTGDLQAGAVAAISGIKNPVRLARLVMERTPHVLLAPTAPTASPATSRAVRRPAVAGDRRALRRFSAASPLLHGPRRAARSAPSPATGRAGSPPRRRPAAR